MPLEIGARTVSRVCKKMFTTREECVRSIPGLSQCVGNASFPAEGIDSCPLVAQKGLLLPVVSHGRAPMISHVSITRTCGQTIWRIVRSSAKSTHLGRITRKFAGSFTSGPATGSCMRPVVTISAVAGGVVTIWKEPRSNRCAATDLLGIARAFSTCMRCCLVRWFKAVLMLLGSALDSQ
jgi:hypothetical protein